MELLLTFSSQNNALRFISLLIIFVVVLGVTYFTTRFIAGYQKGKLSTSSIKVHETFRITTDKYIQVVQIGKRLFALAITKNDMHVLAELSSEEYTIPVAPENKAGFSDFKKILERAQKVSEETEVAAQMEENENEKLTTEAQVCRNKAGEHKDE